MNAQKRKSRPFEGMIRKAVVIVPSDEDYKARIEAQEKADSKEVPDNDLHFCLNWRTLIYFLFSVLTVQFSLTESFINEFFTSD